MPVGVIELGFSAQGAQQIGMAGEVVGPVSRDAPASFTAQSAFFSIDESGMLFFSLNDKFMWPQGDERWQVSFAAVLPVRWYSVWLGNH